MYSNVCLQELAITSDEGLSLAEFPKRVVIAGGGYVVHTEKISVNKFLYEVFYFKNKFYYLDLVLVGQG